MYVAAALLTGFILDILFGDPKLIRHPVRILGSLVTRAEKLFYPEDKGKRRFYGTAMCITIYAVCFGCALSAVLIAKKLNVWLYFALEAFVCFRLLAANSLKKESMNVYFALAGDDITSARRYLSYIVGRDTESLKENEIITAAVETVAENTSDGEIAPLFYFALGGAPLMLLYKAVNTLDSMIGYKNERYSDFGRFAAKTDDLFNLLPAEISGRLITAVSGLCGLDSENSRRIFVRDKHNHTSPNSAKCESAAAGALGIRLGGTHAYFGKIYEKPTIGDDTRPPEAEDIKKTNKLMYASSALAAVLFTVIRIVTVLLLK